MKMAFRRTCFASGIFLLAAWTSLGAQEPSLEDLPGFRERAVLMRMVSQIVEQNKQIVWNSEIAKATIPGRPVGLKLVGSNLVVAVQFTPFLRANGRHILVAQGQIWVNVPDEGIRYYTTMQTIPLQFREQIYFFPLGSMETQDEAQIEIQLIMEPFWEGPSPEEAGNPEETIRSHGRGRRGGNAAPP